MILYIVILYILCSKINNKNRNLYFLIGSLSVAFLLTALRGLTVGEDTLGYINEFKYAVASNHGLHNYLVGALSRRYITDIGYQVFQWIISRFTSNPQVLLASCGLIYVYGIYTILKNNCKYEFVSVLSFLAMMFLQSFNVMRQYVAVGLCCIAWGKKNDKRFVISIFLILIAMLFHRSAIVFFIIFIVDRLKSRRKTFSIILSTCAIFVLFGKQMIVQVIRIIPYFYLYSNRFGLGLWDVSIHGIVVFWIIALILIVLLVFKADWENIDKKYFEATVYSCFYLTCNFVALYFDGFNRLSAYFAPFMLITIDYSINLWKGKSKIFYISFIILLMSTWFMRGTTFNEYYAYSFFS